MDFLAKYLIEFLILISGLFTSIGVMKYQGNSTEKKIDKMSDRMEIRDNKNDTRMEIRDNKMDIRMDNFQNTLHAMELKQVSMDANIANIQKEIERKDEKSN